MFFKAVLKSFCGFKVDGLLGNDTLYWTDLGSNKISRAARDQTWREDVMSTGIVRAEGVAVDWITGTVYGDGWRDGFE